MIEKRGSDIEEYLVTDGTTARHVWAESPEAAALDACSGWSVAHLRLGLTLDVMPLKEASRYKLQYERPNASHYHGENERLTEYGKPVVVIQFQRIAK